MAISFEGRAAIVTGAGRGIGRSYALDIARRGGAVIVNDIGRSEDGDAWADLVVQEIRQAGGRAAASQDSVATADGGEALVETALHAFGRVDAVINNAGFLRPAMFADLTAAQLSEVIDVHLMSGFHVTQPAWRYMQDGGYGRVVFTGSGAAFGNEAGANYAAAKSGLLGLAAGLALEGRPHGIMVNCVMPYAISQINLDNPIMGSDSERNRAALNAMNHRRGPASIAPLVTYLASDTCTVSGQAFSALAGRYARVALMLGPGWIAEQPAEAEDVAAHIDEIGDLTAAFAPRSMTEEIESTLAQLMKLALV